jgi:hypothetical protein
LLRVAQAKCNEIDNVTVTSEIPIKSYKSNPKRHLPVKSLVPTIIV